MSLKITRDIDVVKRTKYSHEKFCSGRNNNEENKLFSARHKIFVNCEGDANKCHIGVHNHSRSYNKFWP